MAQLPLRFYWKVLTVFLWEPTENCITMTIKTSSPIRTKESDNKDDSKTVRVVFISLLLDLLAFTMILPLFPALLDHYQSIDNGKGLYSVFLNEIHKLSRLLNAPENVNTVLFGGTFKFWYDPTY